MKFFYVVLLLLGLGSIIKPFCILCFMSLVSVTGSFTGDEPAKNVESYLQETGRAEKEFKF